MLESSEARASFSSSVRPSRASWATCSTWARVNFMGFKIVGTRWPLKAAGGSAAQVCQVVLDPDVGFSVAPDALLDVDVHRRQRPWDDVGTGGRELAPRPFR